MTPPDYKEKAGQLCTFEYCGIGGKPCWSCADIATALTQADALGYARGRGEAFKDTMPKVVKDNPRGCVNCGRGPGTHAGPSACAQYTPPDMNLTGWELWRHNKTSGKGSHHRIAGGLAEYVAKTVAWDANAGSKQWAYEARALTAEPAKEKP
jgi:hypothetical protein